MNEKAKKVQKVDNSNAKKALLVKNISDKTLHLESGKLIPGDEGVVTQAELSNFANLFEVL
jgi:hypothetical protein